MKFEGRVRAQVFEIPLKSSAGDEDEDTNMVCQIIFFYNTKK